MPRIVGAMLDQSLYQNQTVGLDLVRFQFQFRVVSCRVVQYLVPVPFALFSIRNCLISCSIALPASVVLVLPAVAMLDSIKRNTIKHLSHQKINRRQRFHHLLF
jgi:hypothetical protein